MKSHNDYKFNIQYLGQWFEIDVQGVNINITGFGILPDGQYELIRDYVINEGFIKEVDEKSGVLDLFKS